MFHQPLAKGFSRPVCEQINGAMSQEIDHDRPIVFPTPQREIIDSRRFGRYHGRQRASFD